jgi:hypothetical protein
MPQLDVLSDQYMSDAVNARRRANAPMYRRALSENRNELASRGLLRGGVGAESTLRLQGGFQHDLDSYGSQIGLKQFDVAESRRRAQEARDFQAALQQTAYERRRDEQRRQEWIAEQRANQQFLASMFGSVGGIFGTAAGNFAGGQQSRSMGGAPSAGSTYPETPDIYSNPDLALYLE